MAASRSRRPAPILKRAIEEHKRAAYREAILEAAASVFGRLGFGAAKIADIAAEAGVSVGTLYNYFKNKDAVIDSLVTHESSHYREFVRDAEQIEEPVERIRQLIDASYRFLERHGALLAMAVREGVFQREIAEQHFGESRGEVHFYIIGVYEGALTEAAAAGAVRNDVTPSALAVMLDGAVSSLAFDWVRRGRTQSLHDLSAVVFDTFMKGAQVR